LSDPKQDRNVPHDLTGRELGDYSLLRRLGRGGMADVYLATQKSLNRQVAFKVLKPDLAKDESYVQRFHREAQAAAALVQANIVQIYEVGQADGYHFIAQEYVQGRNLRQYLARNGAVAPVMAINILSQSARALQKSGELHVIHRDIKPENIMLSHKGEVKITDFGLARLNNQTTEETLTQVGITMGTPLYMSPEQVEGGPLDTRSDIYSLGVTAYHMLAGHPPFEGDSPLAIAVQQVKEEAVPLHSLRQDVPEDLCNIIHSMIRKLPEDRPADAKHLLKALQSVKVDFDNDWETILERLAIAEPPSGDGEESVFPMKSTSSRLEATQLLQEAMRGNLRRAGRVPTWAKAVGLFVVSAAAGLGAATINPLPDPLSIEEIADSRIPREESVEAQLEAAYWGTYALRRNDDDRKKEDYWRAVIDYFPIDDADEDRQNITELVHCRALTRLGELYLDQERYEKAEIVFDELSQLDDQLSSHYRLMGFAGMAVVYDNTPLDEFPGGIDERDNMVRQALGQIRGRYELLNSSMREKAEEIFERYPPDS
jgi:serine/threonine-protein kinase